MAKKILISVGEASGDAHAAKLVHDLKQQDQSIEFFGMGGQLMQDAGVEIAVNISQMAVMGLVDVITNFGKIYQAIKTLKKLIHTKKPDLVILVDYPGFNLHLAKIAKKAKCKVLYYISPKLWAWRENRVKIIKKNVAMMAVIFPFEVAFYEKYQVPVKFVGNPLSEKVKTDLSIEETKEKLNLTTRGKIIGLFPGSRISEIKLLLPTMLKTAEILAERYQGIQFILPIASTLSEKDIAEYLANSNLNIRIIKGDIYNAIKTCDAIITTSGTVTLEIALLATPMVIIYKMNSLNYFLAKRFVKIPHIGLCNILAGEQIVPELIQHKANPTHIAIEVNRILENKSYRESMITKLKKIPEELIGTAKTSLVYLILDMIEKQTG